MQDFLKDGRERVKPEKNEWPFVIGGILVFFITLFLYVLKFNIFSQTIQGGKLIKISLLLGAMFGLFLAYVFSRNDVGMEKFRVYAAILFMSLLAFPLYAHLINYGSSSNNILQKEIVISENDSFIHTQLDVPESKVKPDGYYLHFELEGKPMYLRTDDPILSEQGPGTRTTLPIRNGNLGFSVIETKILINESKH